MWHIQKADSSVAYTAPDLQTLQIWCREGRVTEQDRVRQDPDPNWVTAASVFELAAFFARPLSQMGRPRATAAPTGAPAAAVSGAAPAAAAGGGASLFRSSAQADGDHLDLDLTSMMDMTFILLIFLMVISTPAFQHGMAVSLPEAQTGKPFTEKIDVTVSLSSDGEISVDGQRLAGDWSGKRTQLTATLKARRAAPSFGKLILHADSEVSHQKVIDVLDAVRSAQIDDVAFGTKPRKR